jgi:hypothetical protein
MTMIEWLSAHWARLVSGLALAAVAGVAGIISYDHIETLTLALHQTQIVARLMPFGVDGLIIVGSVVLLTATPGTELLGWLGVGPGVAASVFANVESGIRYGWLAATWAGVPAGSFFLACFLLERWLKAQAAVSGGIPDTAGDVSGPVSVRARLNGHAAEAEKLFGDLAAAGQIPGIRRIQTQMRIGQPKARLVQEHLRTMNVTPGGSNV